MIDFTKEDLENARPALTSMINRSEKVQVKFQEGSPQYTLTKNRLKALYIGLSLINNELVKDFYLAHYSYEDLEKALPSITSTIRKCEKAQIKLKEGTPQSTLTRNMLQALYISRSLINNQLNMQDALKLNE